MFKVDVLKSATKSCQQTIRAEKKLNTNVIAEVEETLWPNSSSDTLNALQCVCVSDLLYHYCYIKIPRNSNRYRLSLGQD